MTRAYYTTEDKELTLSRKDINDAGLDVKASENIEILPHSDALIHTGIRVQIPIGYVGFLKSRSGLSV